MEKNVSWCVRELKSTFSNILIRRILSFIQPETRRYIKTLKTACANTLIGRSTKGASRQRRSLINSEIIALRQLLPVSECARQRLSQLQTMSLACICIRNYQLLGTRRESARTSRGCSGARGGSPFHTFFAEGTCFLPIFSLKSA